MNRNQKKLFKLVDQITADTEALRQAREELVYHEHLDDDAQRDAAGGSALDRADARDTATDVARIRRHIQGLEHSIGLAESKRSKLLAKLD